MTSHKFTLLFLPIMLVVAIPLMTHADTFKRILRVGMSGSDISTLQTFLAKDQTIYPYGRVTGYFGALTKTAVASFQIRNGIAPVGQVGPATLKALNAQMNEVASVSSLPPPVNSNIAPAIGSSSTTNQSIENVSVATSTKNGTTFIVKLVPLLAGGIAHGGGSVPISYLQVTNIGNESASLTGFWVKQNGSAPDQSIINLTTIDDKGGSQGSSGGTEGGTPFKNGLAFVPTNALFTPGQTRLFTIKAVLSHEGSVYLGKQLMLDVTSVDSTAVVKGSFPIRGTTWTIAN